jgi:hypothetical protein
VRSEQDDPISKFDRAEGIDQVLGSRPVIPLTPLRGPARPSLRLSGVPRRACVGHPFELNFPVTRQFNSALLTQAPDSGGRS